MLLASALNPASSWRLGGWGLKPQEGVLVLEAKVQVGVSSGPEPSEGSWGAPALPLLASMAQAFLGEWLLPANVCPHLPVAPTVPRKDA